MISKLLCRRNARYCGLFIVTIAVAIASNLASSPKAYAWPFTMGEHIGFFERRSDSYGGSVIQEGMNAGHSSAYNVNNFVSDMRAALYRQAPKATAHNAVGAAFIILTMLGHRQSEYGQANAADNAIITARNVFASWESLVRSYASAGRVNFNINHTYTRNTYWMTGASGYDIAWYTPATETDRAIVFTSPNGTQYAIKHSCGNPVGDMVALQALNWNLSGSTTASVATAIPGQTVTFTHTIRNTGAATATGWRWNIYNVSPTPTSPEVRVVFTGDPVGTTSHAGPNLAGGTGWTFGYNFMIPSGATPGDRYCQRTGYDPVNNASPPVRNGRGTTACVTVVAPPIWSLTGTSAVSTTYAYPGQSVTFTHTIRNQGNRTAGAWSYTVFSMPSASGAETVRVARTSGAALAAGASQNIPNLYTVPATATAGQQFCERILFDPADNRTPATRNVRSTGVCVTVVSPPSYTCAAVTSSGGLVEAGAQAHLWLAVTVNGGIPTTTYSVQYTIGPNPPASGSLGGLSGTVNYTPAAAGAYVVNRTVVGSDGSSHACPPANFVAYAKPYVKVYNGDAQAGAAFATAATPQCGGAAAGGGTIATFNQGAPGFAGSGSEIAAIALGAITEFVSAGGHSATPVVPKGLTFANTAADTYGGNYGSTACVPDYWSLASPSGINYHTGNYTVAGDPTYSATQDIFVEGNAFIDGNIVYDDSGGWLVDSVDNEIPSFRLIVHGGNIYIRNTVTTLEGTYVALPNASGVGGNIYTCAVYSGPLPSFAAPDANAVANSCRQQLRVYGSFVARDVILLRTPNTVRDAVANETATTTRAGEVFILSPDSWIGRLPSSSVYGSDRYDAITSLPPVL